MLLYILIINYLSGVNATKRFVAFTDNYDNRLRDKAVMDTPCMLDDGLFCQSSLDQEGIEEVDFCCAEINTEVWIPQNINEDRVVQNKIEKVSSLLLHL